MRKFNIGDVKRPGILREFFLFLMSNKKWWMIPIILVFVMLMGIVFLSSTGVAPLMYTLF
ncbi:MAG: hypothetical protein FJ088_12860 [Deltaproteobacteria bacterium]|nr:hypothetical protein [Deltaproteobacteria bacterium]